MCVYLNDGIIHDNVGGVLSGEVKVYVTGTVKAECEDKEGVTVVLNLHNTPYIPSANVNLFSLQKMRKADYLVE